MNNLVNQLVAVLEMAISDIPNEVNLYALARTVFLAEMNGGGNAGAINAVISAREAIFPNPTVREIAVALLQRLLPNVPAEGDAQLVAMAEQMDAGGMA